MGKRMVIMLIIVFSIFGLIFGYQLFKNTMMKKYMSGEPPPVVVSAMQVKSEYWDQNLEAVGSLRAVKGVDVTSEIAGLVREMRIKSGKKVCKGEILIKLNDDAERAQLQSLIATEKYANQKYDRDIAQLEIKAVSQAVVDEDISNLKSLQAQILEQKAIIAKKTISAPFSGTLGITTVNPGQYINPGDMIVTLQTLNPIFVDFTLPQQALKNITVGQKVRLKTDAFPEQTFMGNISAINPKIDVSTRNVQVEAMLDNSKLQLLPGMFATVNITIGEAKAFATVPQTSISFNSYGEIGYLVEEKKGKKNEKPTLVAKQVFLKVGSLRGDQAAILSGIKAGDMVVTNGLLKLKNGTKIVINNKIVPSFQANPQVQVE